MREANREKREKRTEEKRELVHAPLKVEVFFRLEHEGKQREEGKSKSLVEGKQREEGMVLTWSIWSNFSTRGRPPTAPTMGGGGTCRCSSSSSSSRSGSSSSRCGSSGGGVVWFSLRQGERESQWSRASREFEERRTERKSDLVRVRFFILKKDRTHTNTVFVSLSSLSTQTHTTQHRHTQHKHRREGARERDGGGEEKERKRNWREGEMGTESKSYRDQHGLWL